jgi:Aminoglycoside-2''-adenylyltransferase
MAAEELGPWDPLRPQDAVSELAAWAAPWWVAGGWAIDLLLGRQTREHGDLDLLVLRRDQASVREELRDWDVHAARPTRQPSAVAGRRDAATRRPRCLVPSHTRVTVGFSADHR